MKLSNKSISIILTLVLGGSLLGGALAYYQYSSKTDFSEYSYKVPVTDIGEANNQFAFDLYHELHKDLEEDNIVFSPYSIYIALQMLSEGAKDVTAQELQDALYLKEEFDQQGQTTELLNRFNQEDAPYTLELANALWLADNMNTEEEFLSTLQEVYQSQAQDVDFKRDASQITDDINNWAAKNTNDKIKNLLSDDDIGQDTKLVLANAIYFQSDWQTAFDSEKTEDDDFRLADGSVVETPFMTFAKNKGSFPYGELKGAQIIEFPYKAQETEEDSGSVEAEKRGDLVMQVILPPDHRIDQFEDQFSRGLFSALQDELRRQRVEVYMPSFTVKPEESYKLQPSLQNLGLNDMFNPWGANNFENITTDVPLFVSFVKHKAFIEVDESGSEAAAATAIGADTLISLDSSPPPSPPVFRANHPFLFVIYDKESDLILFMGKVQDPR